ncbi:MAG TPA: 3-dehydroquinate synthase [Desulfomonilaceae bacterium]|nr:3-dehydroquinate synthase [Desulfomonilaceae bacterium]
MKKNAGRSCVRSPLDSNGSESEKTSSDSQRGNPPNSKLRTNIILTGFMGTGKTAVGMVLAKRLGWKFLDTDRLISELESMSVTDIFARRGEAHFRTLENTLCERLVTEKHAVIATGGGMPVNPSNRKLLNAAGLVVNLRCDPEESIKRIKDIHARPMLATEDPLQQARELLKERESAYSSFLFQMDTLKQKPYDVASRILQILKAPVREARFQAVNVSSISGYTITIGSGVLVLLGEMMASRGLSKRIAVVTDTHVGPLYLDPVLSTLRSAGFAPFACTVPAGEQSKNSDQLAFLYDRFVEEGLDRRGAVVALGGGVIGDLAGFAAATYMRGVAFVQCPTSLLAMVDSSVGGKTGIDLPQGKNLVGAFKQPILVAADLKTLDTLPKKQVAGGMAELIKHAVIDDAELFAKLEKKRKAPVLTPDLIADSVDVKIRVVEEDPYESGRREVLNLGHTVGHALEKCSKYSLNHGDAISIGLVAAALISNTVGMCASDIPGRLEKVLSRSGLPVRHGLDPDEVVSVMVSDKKTVDGRVRFVLINDIGQVQNGLHVPPATVKAVLKTLRN